MRAGPASARTPAFRRLPRAVREEQMLDAAVAVFSRRGFHAASMDEIAERAEVSKLMVYAYLGAKEDLFIACLHRVATRLMEAIAAVVRPDLAPDQQLWNGLRAFFGFVGKHRDGWSVLYRQARGQEVRRHLPRNRRELDDVEPHDALARRTDRRATARAAARARTRRASRRRSSRSVPRALWALCEP